MKIGTRFFLTMLFFGLAALGGLIWLFQGLLVPWHTQLMTRQARETVQLVQQVRPWLPPDELQRLCEKIKRHQAQLPRRLRQGWKSPFPQRSIPRRDDLR